MTKARDIADFKFENITDTGTEGTKVASGTTAQRGSTAGQFRFNSTTGLAEYYNGATFKSIDAPPSVTSIDVTEIDSQAGGNQTIVITGTSFASGATVTFVGNNGVDFNASTVTINSSTQITAVAPKSSFLNAQEPYSVKVSNSSGLSATLTGQINIDSSPTFNVASGSLGSLTDIGGTSLNASNLTNPIATDADGDTITYAIQSGSLPTGITLNSNGTFSGAANTVSSDTTSTFTVRATANSKTADRQYTILVKPPIFTGGFTSVDTSVSGYLIYAFTNTGSQTTTLNSTKSADVLIVAGGGSGGQSNGNNDKGSGGGGAGQVLFRTGYSISSGNYTFNIGVGGAGEDYAQGSVTTNNGGNSTAFGLTANGGGGGGTGDGHVQAQQGGSAGGSGARDSWATTSVTSNKTTPSGWNSYGNNGGTSNTGNHSGGGGGGAGAAGSNQSGGSNDSGSLGGNGGVGIDLSSTFGTNLGENGYFGGGGGGSTYRGAQNSSIAMATSSGGLGGGGDGVASTDRNSGSVYQFIATSNELAGFNRDGLSNTGGGGGGAAEDFDKVANAGSACGAGGSGVILIRVAA